MQWVSFRGKIWKERNIEKEDSSSFPFLWCHKVGANKSYPRSHHDLILRYFFRDVNLILYSVRSRHLVIVTYFNTRLCGLICDLSLSSFSQCSSRCALSYAWKITTGRENLEISLTLSANNFMQQPKAHYFLRALEL